MPYLNKSELLDIKAESLLTGLLRHKEFYNTPKRNVWILIAGLMPELAEQNIVQFENIYKKVKAKYAVH